MNVRDYFIDCHCHFFNIDDVPLYATVAAQVPVRTVYVLAGLLRRVVRKKLEQQRPFIEFFESAREKNLRTFAYQIRGARDPLDKKYTILTPLVMDFDLIKGSRENVAWQVDRLVDAIRKEAGELDNHKTRVFPFLGVDLRRFDRGDVAGKFDALLASCEGMKPSEKRARLGSLANGDLIGLKLYPPIGFYPSPPQGATNWKKRRRQYREFFRLCAEREIPITVHCQPGSYRPHPISEEEAGDFAHPAHWRRVMEEFPRLRVNFAHFGGDGQVVETVLRRALFGGQVPKKTLKKSTWTYALLELLKRYEHTYADISAYDLKDAKAVLALRALLVLDESGVVDEQLGIDKENRPLKTKLLWGSDVPMILDHYRDYCDLFSRFLEAADLSPSLASFNRTRTYSGMSLNVPSVQELTDHLVSTNPFRFLLGR